MQLGICWFFSIGSRGISSSPDAPKLCMLNLFTELPNTLGRDPSFHYVFYCPVGNVPLSIPRLPLATDSSEFSTDRIYTYIYIGLYMHCPYS